jgi:succinoglycan biosynthesis protein ExoM
MAEEKPHVSVCICTYKRPALLRGLLDELGCQVTAGLFTYSIVVADNDESQSAKTVVSEFAARSDIPITYCVQPRRNIALARNTTVENATGDFIAFIDDDEFPTKRWLLTLLNACSKCGADGVLGPVIPYFDETTPRWVIKGGFYDRPTHPNGMRLVWSQTRTGNVLIRSRLFVEGQRFNPAFLAASDQAFFRTAITKGHAFSWCNDAVVYEVIPPGRCKRSFLVRKALFKGAFSRRIAGSAIFPFVLSFIAAPAYFAALPIALVLGQATFMKYTFKLCYHLGRLLALVGVNPIKEAYVTE